MARKIKMNGSDKTGYCKFLENRDSEQFDLNVCLRHPRFCKYFEGKGVSLMSNVCLTYKIMKMKVMKVMRSTN